MDMTNGNLGANTSLRIAIVGAGPTGTTVLERLVALASERPDRTVEIAVWEPNTPGVGVHSPDQSEIFQLNTIANQINGFAGSSPHWQNGTKGPSFYEWLSGRPDTAHYRREDYAPRRLCGKYQSELFDVICKSAPSNVKVTVNREKVKSIVRAVSGKKYLLKGEGGTQAWVDQLCCCQGHVGREPQTHQASDTRIIERPCAKALERIQPGEVVGVQGLGLVGSDVTIALTRGRGGRFRMRDGLLAYLASGAEPTIWLCSRSGMPFHARPFAAPERQPHLPLILTRRKIDLLRTISGGSRRLDFAGQILPLLKSEMSVAYNCVREEIEGAGRGDALRAHLAAMACFGDPSEIRVGAELDGLNRRHGRFDPDRYLMLTPPPEASGENYPHWVRTFLTNDVGDAELGLLQSPTKAALEICRDLRDVLRYAVDFDGLSETSHQEFYRIYAPLFNRLVGGPAMERNRELIALLDAGIVRLPPGPVATVRLSPEEHDIHLVPGGPNCAATRPIPVDWVVRAHEQSSGIIRSASGPLNDLHKAGLLTSVRSVPGLDGIRVDRLSRPIDAEGGSVENIAILGPLTEGARYYNHYIATAGGPCRLLDDADIVARRMLGLPMPSEQGRCFGERAAS